MSSETEPSSGLASGVSFKQPSTSEIKSPTTPPVEESKDRKIYGRIPDGTRK